MARSSIRFLLGDRKVELSRVDANEMLLDYLRLREHARGTKEGCAEGDCGACTVVLGELLNGNVHYRPITSCIQLLGMVDGKQIITVEDLAGADGLHPVQQAMVDYHGSQCGFCTPGIVMALFALYHAGVAINRAAIDDWLAGNLCRCTGYRPIVDAARSLADAAAEDKFTRDRDRVRTTLESLATDDDVIIGDANRFFASPASVSALLECYAEHPDATLVGGATDVGLWITKELRSLPKVIYTGRVAELKTLSTNAACVELGAAVNYQDTAAALTGIDPDIGEVLRRLGSVQIRSAGTLGGNIANGSPIGDMPPILIALGATLLLRTVSRERRLAIEDFFLDYGKQDRAPGEVLVRVRIPTLTDRQVLRCFKISKRFDQDISALLLAIRLTLDAGKISDVRIACGGMAATPKRAPNAERVLAGALVDDEAARQRAVDALATDFTPISDMRASADYRMAVAKGLLRKALIEIAGEPGVATRLIPRADHRERYVSQT